jgi:hypothetical protein
MPYNPSSAYPRHSTYTPPVYDRGFAKGFNEIPWGTITGRASLPPGADVRHAIREATTPGTKEHIAASLQAMGRQGILSNAMATVNRRSEQLYGTQVARKVWNRAEYGDDPNELGGTAASSNIADRPPPMSTAMRSAGGREHVAGINERLGAISQREESSSAMDEVIDTVLGGNVGGPMKIPLWRRGFTRRRGG